MVKVYFTDNSKKIDKVEEFTFRENKLFTFGGVKYNKFNISSNGYIFFGTDSDILKGNVSKSLTKISWNVLSPFSGKLFPTNDGITVDQQQDKCVIIFNCYSNQTDTLNILKFGINLWFDTNFVDFFYISCTSRSNNFYNDVYIGATLGSGFISEFRYISNTEDMIFWYGNAHVGSDNKFPDVQIISNILNISPSLTKILPNAVNGHTVGTPLGGTFYFNDPDLHLYGVPDDNPSTRMKSFTSCNINSDGSILFGEYSEAEWDPYSNGSTHYKKLFAFNGPLKTTQDGITINRDIHGGKCTITFNCHPSHNSSNIIRFSVILYYETSRVDYQYFTPFNLDDPRQEVQGLRGDINRIGGFNGDYYIGYTNRNGYICVQNVDDENNSNNFIPGASPITPDAINGIIYWYYFPPAIVISDVLGNDLYSDNITRYLPNVDDGMHESIPIGGIFNFGGVDYTTCGINSNGSVYFTKVTYQDNNTANNLISGKRMLPFQGDFKVTLDGINFNRMSNLKKTVIEFNVYSYWGSTSNPIKFEIILYYKDHPIRPNQYDFHYVSYTHNNKDNLDYYSDSVYIYSNNDINLINVKSTNSVIPTYEVKSSENNPISISPKLFPEKGSMYSINTDNILTALENHVKSFDTNNFINVGAINVDDHIFYDENRHLHGKIVSINPRMLSLFYTAFDSNNTDEDLKRKKFNIFFRTFQYKAIHVS